MKYVSVAEASNLFSISKPKIHQAILRGVLKTKNKSIGCKQKLYVSLDDMKEFVLKYPDGKTVFYKEKDDVVSRTNSRITEKEKKMKSARDVLFERRLQELENNSDLMGLR